jgi:hypothetical protein
MGEGKMMRFHRYNSLAIIGGRIFSHCFVLLLNMVLIAVWWDCFAGSLTTLSLGDAIGITAGILVGNIMGMTIAKFNPDLAASGSGLAVRFYFNWLFVPWEDVISVTRSFVSARPNCLVRAKRLTIIRRLVSFSQSGSIQPGFLISPSISDYPDLLRTIREHVGEA